VKGGEWRLRHAQLSVVAGGPRSIGAAVLSPGQGRLLHDSGGRKVHLVVDGHPVHRAKLVSAFIGRHAERIQPHVLPG
jgi:hypothetical protein